MDQGTRAVENLKEGRVESQAVSRLEESILQSAGPVHGGRQGKGQRRQIPFKSPLQFRLHHLLAQQLLTFEQVQSGQATIARFMG
ncbi:hypothetical protein PAHAL_1G445700 [Panicum hallii]|jgi:hypothetical protein|uniref:Uncharacterized protein n=1 Tax=Panicum hallii TaxID=206008 RepID=A0A2T8KYC7_9POAL|nr:hypothetical protein PAHAL_1G445700 [Panicum hallii]